jgi:hypothetical protein
VIDVLVPPGSPGTRCCSVLGCSSQGYTRTGAGHYRRRRCAASGSPRSFATNEPPSNPERFSSPHHHHHRRPTHKCRLPGAVPHTSNQFE